MKYKGSKQRLMKYLNPIFNEYKNKHNLTTFIDVFGGGANVSSNVNFDTVICNDNDEMLIALLKETQQNPSNIEMIPTPSKELYDKYKKTIQNNEMDKYDFPLYYYGAILFFGSFNARAYGGNYGATSVTKEGKLRDYFQEAKRNILKQKLSHITFINKDYKNIPITENSLIYLDPPYINTTGYKGSIDYDEFWNWVREISKNNIVLISELEAPSDFEILWEKELIHGQNQHNKQVKTEKLFKLKGRNNG